MTDSKMTEPLRQPKSKRAGGYLFIPKSLQSSDVILWLRRMHAWTGVYGAVFFFCLGLSGFYLNHRDQLKIEGGTMREVASLSVIVEPYALETDEALSEWMRAEFAVSADPVQRRGQGAERVIFNGKEVTRPQKIEAMFRGPNATIVASHEIGSNIVTVKRSDASFIKTLTNLHKGVGVKSAYVLLVDTIAGAMIFMTISGVLLWTRLHGGRLVAAGIMSAIVVMAAMALSTAWISWSAH